MFNEILEGGLNQLLTRRLGMKLGSPAPAVAPEVFPSMNLESDRPEWGFIKGEQLMGYGELIAAGTAADYGQCWLINPVGSGTLITITRISATTAGNHARIRTARSVDAGAAVGSLRTNGWMDTRWAGSGVLLLRRVAITLPVLTYREVGMATNQMAFEKPIVLGPGTTCHFYGETPATAFSFDVQWMERVALPGELV